MGINHLLLAMALFNLVVSTRSMDDSISQILQEQKKRYCGKFLADTLATLCKGNYQTIIPGSASTRSYPFQSRSLSTSMLGSLRRKRRKRGVYNECCEHTCSKEQLSLYCAADNSSS
ncbi:bombyxin B-1 homolog [Sitophilus oryzae]|uniref:Bombyxin B-1 homolog n=1 Tax=Sitophilus oryzae TaxID=7048 RepID=A0A6J2Y863_SITOR|nr:bombyxin B-1 homolog [Sitophilus oryzae]